jgi:phage-related minor tail protein
MDTIDITITKNKLQILMLQARENIKEKATNSKKEALDTLTDAYSTIVYLQAALDDLRKKNLIAEQNNVKAYRQNKKLKQKFSKFV